MSSARTPPDSSLLIRAAWVAPMIAPPFRDGAVVCRAGRITAVGDARTLHAANPDAHVHDAGDAVLLPGLVNAHTHLELSDCSPGEPPASFGDWIMRLAGRTAVGTVTADLVQRAVETGVAQCLRFGVTTVGDISKQCAITRPILRDGPLRVTSYGEIQAMARRRHLLDERFALAADLSSESPHLRVGLSPHAPYTVEPAGYARCLAFCRAHNRPLATHLAETPDEAHFLAEQSGPFRDLWEIVVNAWDDQVPRYEGGPIRFAAESGLLDYPTLLAHVNYCDDDELAILARGQASVVYCPRTHQYFGHPSHRWREMLTRGINVAVGTDSCASSPDLNLVDDLRLLHRVVPEVPAQRIWDLATINAARALQLAGSIGQLSTGATGDITAFPAHTDYPLEEILTARIEPSAIWIGGLFRPQSGGHP
jgi:cytosine/adenosine deaminase-related metal-dependent hydrolase